MVEVKAESYFTAENFLSTSSNHRLRSVRKKLCALLAKRRAIGMDAARCAVTRSENVPMPADEYNIFTPSTDSLALIEYKVPPPLLRDTLTTKKSEMPERIKRIGI